MVMLSITLVVFMIMKALVFVRFEEVVGAVRFVEFVCVRFYVVFEMKVLLSDTF